jgi:hypothetical protein
VVEDASTTIRIITTDAPRSDASSGVTRGLADQLSTNRLSTRVSEVASTALKANFDQVIGSIGQIVGDAFSKAHGSFGLKRTNLIGALPHGRGSSVGFAVPARLSDSGLNPIT